MKFFGKSDTAQSEPELQMTPMIDCIFLLLIFFMCCTKFKTLEGNLRSDIPEAKEGVATESVDDEPEVQIVKVSLKRTREGRVLIFVNRASVGSAMQLADKLQRLREQFKRAGMQAIVVIDPFPDVPFGDIVSALNECIRVGFEDIAFAPPRQTAG